MIPLKLGVRISLVVLVAAFAALLADGVELTRGASPAGDEAVMVDLDTHRLPNAPAIETGPVLEDGVGDRVLVKGTWSKWSANQWGEGVCVGTPENAPMSSSFYDVEVDLPEYTYFRLRLDTSKRIEISVRPERLHVLRDAERDGGSANPSLEHATDTVRGP